MSAKINLDVLGDRDGNVKLVCLQLDCTYETTCYISWMKAQFIVYELLKSGHIPTATIKQTLIHAYIERNIQTSKLPVKSYKYGL